MKVASVMKRAAVVLLVGALLSGCGGDSPPTAPKGQLVPGVLAAVGTDPVSGAKIETSQDDYVPGEVVHLTGTGWGANETVHLFMTEDPDTHADVEQDVQADSTGAFTLHFYVVTPYDLGVTFTLTATGLSSGSSATVVFTDGNVSFDTSPASLVSSATYNRYNSNPSCVSPANSIGNTLSYNTNLGLNSGQSILITIPTVAGHAYASYTVTGTFGAPVSPASAPSNSTLCVAGITLGGTPGRITLKYTVSSISTTTSVAASPTPSVFGQSVTFTATVTPASGPAATGTVNFYKFTGVQTCSALGGASVLGSDGSAPFEYTTSALSVANHTISACYVPGSGWTASNGSTTHTVNQANTSTTLVSSLDPSNAGAAVTFTPTVAVTAPGAGTPTGTVTLYEFTLGQTCALPGAAVALGSAAVGTPISGITSLSAGNHTLTACYAGNPDFSASEGTDTHAVQLLATVTGVTSSNNPSVTGQSTTFTATVTSSAIAIGATGTITFHTGTCAGTALTAALPLNGSGQATYSNSYAASGGNVTIAACFSGTGIYAASFGTILQTVNKANTTTSLGSSLNPSTYGQSVTFTATIAVVAPGVGVPTGSVTFHEFESGGSCSSPNGTLLSTQTVSAGSAALSVSTLGAGSHTITACYGGDSDFNGSGDDVSQTVNQAPLTITANNRSKTYGDVVTFAGTEFTPSGLQNSETIGSVTLTSNGAAGTATVAGSTYPIVPSAATGGTFSTSNYSITYANGALTVSPRALTITANNNSKFYGDVVTFLGTEFTSSGLQNGETIGSVTLTSTGAAAAALVGPHAIIPSAATGGTFTPGNYSPTYVNGTLTVNAWTLTGFYQPVDMSGVFNSIKSGQTVPLKFEAFAGTTEKVDVAVVKSFVQTKLTCPAAPVIDEIEIVSTGGTVLRYDSVVGQFIQNWQTPKGAGLCYRVTMTTQDLSTIVAYFITK